ncbi:MAG: Asp23/Gls24 family envelope stress response protein [Desulfotomaculaceae bacterium]|nr:Asp23/Gls24 family envelope stress response protein [Desulfotomaculaceae bacterium]
MESSEISTEVSNRLGSIRIAEEVVKIIAGMSAIEIKGVAGMSGGIAGGIAELLGKKNLAKGIKVEVGEKEAAIDIYVIINYGIRIPDVAAQIQSSVKKAVESMTGLIVIEVNVNVQGIVFTTDAKEEEHRVK